jgi:hypothetical protein
MKQAFSVRMFRNPWQVRMGIWTIATCLPAGLKTVRKSKTPIFTQQKLTFFSSERLENIEL